MSRPYSLQPREDNGLILGQVPMTASDPFQTFWTSAIWERMQTIKLMADYGCWPLWEASPGRVGNIDPADLPLSKDLRDRLQAWADIYDGILNQDNPIKSGFATSAAEQRFVEQGKALGAELQAELGDAYQVLVHAP